MGTAILSGLLKAGLDANNVTVSTKSSQSANRLAETYGVTGIAVEVAPNANQLAVANADVVLLAVKPAYIPEVLEEVASHLQDGALLISVAAGVTIATMEARVAQSVAVVRSMPNTPAIVGRAVTGVAAGSRVSPEQLRKAVALFETVGRVVELGEDQIDELGTISGSGPAYVFFLIEKFTQTAIEMGFDAETAAMLVEDTFLGASELLVASTKTPAELRRQVTSPNGTTERAIAKLEAAALEQTFVSATKAALARSKELAAGK
jgi:pyrroline-5-carboxylate reductase